MQSKYPFLNVLYDLIGKIAEAQNVKLTDSNRHYLLKGFTQRKSRFFPEDDLIDTTHVMTRDDYEENIRERLLRARCIHGLCLGTDDLRRLDEAFSDYQIESASPIARIGEKIPKAFERVMERQRLSKGDLDSIVLFRKVLADEVMAPFWQGKKQNALSNADSIRAALLRGHPCFEMPADDRMLWDDLLLGVAGFCRMVDGDGFHNAYNNVLLRRQGKDENAFRRQQLLQLAHFEDPKNLSSASGLSALKSGGAGLYGELEGAFMKIRAACSAIELGCSLDSKPHFLEGHAVEDLMKEGLAGLGETASLQSRLNCEAYLLRAHALNGRLVETIGGAATIRGKCGSEKVGPHLEAMLLLNEALAYGHAKGNGGYMDALAGKLVELRRLCSLHSVPTIWQFDMQHIEMLERLVRVHSKEAKSVYYDRR